MNTVKTLKTICLCMIKLVYYTFLTPSHQTVSQLLYLQFISFRYLLLLYRPHHLLLLDREINATKFHS